MAVWEKWKRFYNADHIHADDKKIIFGSDSDASIKWDSTNSLLEILPGTDDTGVFTIGDGTTDMDVKFFLGSTSSYALFDVGNASVQVVQSNAATSGTKRSLNVGQTHTGAGATAEVLIASLTSDVKIGSWGNAVYGKVDLSEDGYTDGLIGAVCAEINMPSNGVTGGAGTYACYEAEINCPTGYDSTVPLDVMRINVWGDTATQFDDYGYLFDITGVTSGSGDFWYANKSAPFDAYLRIRIDGTAYYLGVLAQQAAAS